ncbi:serine hydrolase [Paenibacillus alvei]|uniref:serine hydrolase n=1 Tax=Paenibacillus alvei TaxID=44250 RepID=UPI0013DB5D4D|nr:serine hydrolase [Paenibacillus alvei]NEZ41000.1 serine hydrolase [Paenibacillus alvei]
MAYEWQARHGLSSAQYQAEFNSLVSQGYRLIDINGYSVGGVDRYAAIWEKSPGYEWQARHGLSSADHQTLFTTLASQGYRPICVSGYEVAGTDRYASLWYKVSGPEWRARHGMNAAEYQSEFANWSSQGFLLWRISGYEVAGQNFYAAIWIKGPHLTWWSRHGLSDAEYQTEFNSMLARGFRLVKVNGYPLRGEARYAAIWHKPYLSDDDQSFIRQTVTTFMNNHRVPGASLALTQFGRLVFAQGYGLANQAANEPVTTSTLFRIASVSKPITSVAVFKLIEAGLLNLGDRVFGPNAILGTIYGTQPYGANINQITVQHLLEHTSGWAQSQDPMFSHFNLNQHELITWMLDNSPLTFVPGQTFDYLNFGYCVLGRVIEQVSSTSYADYVRQHVLAPCGISDMHIAGDTLAERRPNEAVYYTQSGWNPYAIRVSRMDAHGGWIASATDLARFLVHVDRFPTKLDILSSGSLATMYTPTTASRADGSPVNYAKGWNIHPSGNYWHDGDLPGTASIAVRTNDGFCWAVLVNSRNDAQLQNMRSDLDNLMWTIVGRIRDWPSFDLF